MVNFDKSQYKVKRLFHDEHFENGFIVYPMEYDLDRTTPGHHWAFPETKGEPKWEILQLYSKYCFWNERKDVGNPYVLTDTHDSKVFTYNPEEKSITFKLNAQNIYEGEHTVPNFWPHLLIEQRHICDYKNMPEGEEKRFYSANSDKICVEMDVKIHEFIPTPYEEDVKSCEFVSYTYLQHIDKNHVYVGCAPFVANWHVKHSFFKESGGANYVYQLPEEIIHDGIENSFNRPDGTILTGEWQHIEVDLTPHIDKILEKANNELIFGRPVTRDEFYFSGTNMGFEIHGNMSCTIEVKNYNLVSYIKK